MNVIDLKRALTLVMSVLIIASLFPFGGISTVYAAGTMYYVSPTGNDSNNGTSSSTPWKTINKVNTISFSAGDQVLFQGGQTFTGQLTLNNVNGANGSPITIGSYGTGRATIAYTAGQQDNRFEYFGNWNINSSDPNGYQGDCHWSNTTNNYWAVKFYGTQAQVYMDRGSWSGIVGITVDGFNEVLVDTYSSSFQASQSIYTTQVLKQGEHIIKVRVTGTKNASATDYQAEADRIDVYNGGTPTTINDSVTQIHDNNIVTYYGYGWKHNVHDMNDADYTQYSYGLDPDNRYTSNSGDYAELPFYGDRIKAYTKLTTWSGKVGYSIDGGTETVVDCYNSWSTGVDLTTPRFDSGTLTRGQHTLKIRATGQKNSSSSGIEIIVDAFDVVNNGVTTRINDSGEETCNAIYINNSSYITVNNINVVGNGRYCNNFGSGVSIYKGNYITVNNVEASGFLFAGIRYLWSSNLTITNIDAHDNGEAGIRSFDLQRNQDWSRGNSNIYMSDCYAHNNPGDPTYPSYCAGDGIGLMIAKTATVQYCTAALNGWDVALNNSGGGVGIWGQALDNVTIQNCSVYDMYSMQGNTWRPDGSAYDIDGINSTLQYSYSRNCQGSSLLSWRWNYYPNDPVNFNDNDVFRYNISEFDGWGLGYRGVVIASDKDQYKSQPITWKIYNNTIYNPQGNAYELFDWTNSYATSSAGVKVLNNIFYTTKNFCKDGNTYNSVWQGNCYFSEDNQFNMDGCTSLSQWRSTTGKEKNGSSDTGMYANPALSAPGSVGTSIMARNLGSITAYKLLSDSPCINAGLDLNALYGINNGGKDFWGNIVPTSGSCNIGAYGGSGVAESTFGGNTFKIINVNSGKALDVYQWSTADQGVIDQYTYYGNANQKWTISYAGKGYYKIINVNSGKALDVYQWSTADGGGVDQYTYYGNGNQLWTITKDVNGNYKIINKNSGKSLEVYNSSTADGATVDQRTTSNGANNQLWQISAP